MASMEKAETASWDNIPATTVPKAKPARVVVEAVSAEFVVRIFYLVLLVN